MLILTIQIKDNAEEKFNMMFKIYGRVFGLELKNQQIFRNTKLLLNDFSL